MTGVRLERGHRRAVVLTVVITQLIVALATGSIVWAAYSHLDDRVIPGPPPKHHLPQPPKGPLNILVMGSDSRVGAGNDIDGQTDIGQRSDTTILVHVSADRKTVYGISLPRDAMVARPDCEGARGKTIPGADVDIFNNAFSLGGPTCTAEQVETLTGIYIDHYVSLDFNGFKDMVDAVHGVEVCIPSEIDDTAHGIHLDAGVQELNGQQALNYVRERYSTPNADIGRMKRQQAFIASMINKVVSAGTLTRPSRVYHFLEAATGSVTTDPDLASLSDLVKLAYEFRKIDLHNITFVTVPFEEYPPDHNRLQWAPDAAGLWKAIKADKPLPKRYKEQAISADKPPGTPTDAASGSASGSGSASSSPSPTGGSTENSGASSSGGQPEADQNGLCA